jgi:hypothetical protein
MDSWATYRLIGAHRSSQPSTGERKDDAGFSGESPLPFHDKRLACNRTTGMFEREQACTRPNGKMGHVVLACKTPERTNAYVMRRMLGPALSPIIQAQWIATTSALAASSWSLTIMWIFVLQSSNCFCPWAFG